MKKKKVSPSRVVIQEFRSRVLKGNPLGDPAVRNLHIYFPPGYSSEKKYPALLGLVGLTGTGAMLLNNDTLSEDLKSRLDRLILTKKCKPCIVVLPDCFNRIGGSQYNNSPAIGNYEDYLVKEIIPFVNQNYPVKSWAVFGKSSGGYGAMVLGMKYPHIFQALADHSGDSNFELCYLPDVPKALDSFREAGGPARWLKKFWGDENRKRREYFNALNVLAMAAHYSPNPRSKNLKTDFPFDLETGIFLPEVWKRWQKWDPVYMIPRYRNNLKKLKLVYIDCGTKDEFALHWGARAKRKALLKIRIKPVYREFNDGHMNISYRYDESIPRLVKAIS
ncbi:MAG: esterase [Bacteroidetes bacterium]|nr:esterase [Bacteroidota bacterium]